MALTREQFARVDALLSSAEAGAQALGELRSELPGVPVTRCDVSDLGVEEPFRRYPRFHLYLVDGTDHCWRITQDPSRATGLVVVHVNS